MLSKRQKTNQLEEWAKKLGITKDELCAVADIKELLLRRMDVLDKHGVVYTKPDNPDTIVVRTGGDATNIWRFLKVCARFGCCCFIICISFISAL